MRRAIDDSYLINEIKYIRCNKNHSLLIIVIFNTNLCINNHNPSLNKYNIPFKNINKL